MKSKSGAPNKEAKMIVQNMIPLILVFKNGFLILNLESIEYNVPVGQSHEQKKRPFLKER
jgi:hypothetical protein